MKLILHAGVHFTEEDRLMKCLLRNADDFAARGVMVPGQSKYRGIMRETLNAMVSAPASEMARDVLMDAMLDEGEAERVILSDANFFRTPKTAVQEGMFYPAAPVRMMRMAQIFDQDDVEIFLGIRNPATLLPILYSKAEASNPADFWGSRDPRDILWSDTLDLLRQSVPDVPITVWCNEDTPLIWAHIIRQMAGLPDDQKIIGGFDLLSSIMSSEGMKRFRAYLKDHPVMTEHQKRRAIAAFLDKYALDDQVEEELDMPGWTEDLVDEMSDIYDNDVATIAALPGVRVLMP
ncbi:hypothetical protein [Sulfitobacter donghicola]|uniref:Sulfotransferase domain-containing protein n=1 Tax=Sulfitobacter donghicola DSW-25 = KCTC 12864 = JCM 14565 TaxID=1300350 RepID=A0A073IKQ7_9RHOB|nr:hypothetical protein [Sulfitobacter donghicola]KEJ90155.1 hypothetical protein DSW25_08130 [Sulfitobacter donghicola DSW-25 = KCTC 12864 = JCM 14565]KIN66687.1 hypothetical protein Z948_387 [Sulfitobacter donghicola DSW-25 = KCTC 12864 = JCM 14565]